MSSFQTIETSGYSDYTVTRSRFIGCCLHVENEEEVQTFISSVKKDYWDAKHHCFAYVLGKDSSRIRYSDDGEPSGTAGLPILNAIESNELTNTLIIVTRYFGGVLLGTGGLTRAYSKAAFDAIENASVVSMEECCSFNVRIPYSLWPKLNAFFANNCLSFNNEYAEDIFLKGLVSKKKYKDFCVDLIDRSEGRLHPELQGIEVAKVRK